MLLPLPGGAESLLILLLALVIEGCVGDSRLLDRLLPRPAALFRDMALWFDRRLNRIDRTEAERRARGVLVAGVAALLALAAGLAVAVIGRGLPYGWVLELLVVLRVVELRRGWTGLSAVPAALERGGLEAARAAVAPLTDRQAWSLDAHGVLRAAVESAAALLLTGVVAPVFWYALIGPPGLLLWAAALGLYRALGHDTPRYRAFGRAAGGIMRALGWLPARLSLLLTAAASLFIPRARGLEALRTAWPVAGRHPMGPAAWPVAALAGALGLALGGPRREGEMLVQEPWLGEGRARLTPRDLRPAAAICAVTILLTALAAVGLGLALLAG